MSDVSHTVCFKNLMSCLMSNLPFITVMTILTLTMSVGWAWVTFFFGDFITWSGEPPYILKFIVYGGIGTVVHWLGYVLLFIFVPYLWKEVMAIVPAIRNCVKCRGERNSY